MNIFVPTYAPQGVVQLECLTQGLSPLPRYHVVLEVEDMDRSVATETFAEHDEVLFQESERILVETEAVEEQIDKLRCHEQL